MRTLLVRRLESDLLQARVILALLLVLSAPTAFAGPVIRAVEIDSPPTIDGVLDELCWTRCDKIADFKESNYGRGATEPTEVMLCRDKEHLYVAFICRDSQPARIRAAQTQTNSDISSDDYAAVLLDPENSHLGHYSFEVNAIGTQFQSLPDGAPANITWRGDWKAAAGITDSGWQAEMAIPFAALRYPIGQRTFGIHFRRYIPRLDECGTWPFVGAVMDQTRFAELTDLELPVQTTRPVFMPYTLTSTEPGRSFTDVGLDYKHELPNRHTALATYNPDFTDVQDAVASISYSYTEQYLPEHRPFFQEGANLFPDSMAFYSRRIGQIDWGVKTFGKSGPHTIALVDAVKSGSENHFAGSYAYDPTPDLAFSLWAAASTLSPAASSTPGTSMCVSPGFVRRWRADSGTTYLTCRRYSALNFGSLPDGSALRLSLEKEAAPRSFDYAISYGRTNSDYYVRDGYAPLTGVRGFFLGLGYHDRPAAGRLNYWRTDLNITRYWSEDDSLHHGSVSLSADWDTPSEWGFGGSLVAGSWLGQSDSTIAARVSWLERHLYGRGSLVCYLGKRAGRDYAEVDVSQSYRLARRVTISLSRQWTRLGAPGSPEVASQLTLLGNYELAPDRVLGVWLVGRGSSRNMCLTYRQTVRTGSDIYLIYGYPNTLTTEQRLALKMVMPIAW